MSGFTSGFTPAVYSLPLEELPHIVALLEQGRRWAKRSALTLPASLQARVDDMALVADAIAGNGNGGNGHTQGEDTEAHRGAAGHVIVGAMGEVGVQAAAELLGVSARRARQLAPALGGRRAAGRWVLSAGAVEAERRRRHG